MKPILQYTALACFPVLLAGCLSASNQPTYEKQLGLREQKSILARARPLEDFGFLPSFPYGNGMIFIGTTQLKPNQSATASFQKNGLPIIEYEGKPFGKKLAVLLDTSSNASWIQYSAAKRNKVSFLQLNGRAIPYLGTESTGGVNTYAGVVPLLQIGEVALQNTPFYVRMAEGLMQPVVYSSSIAHVDAVLGYDNLRRFQYIQFDLGNGTVKFSTSDTYVPDENRLMGKVGISPICADRLAVNGSIFGNPVPVVLDFAGDYAFARSDTREAITPQVEFGDVVWRNVKTDVLALQDRFPRAGRQMLEKYIVTICPGMGVVYFERPGV